MAVTTLLFSAGNVFCQEREIDKWNGLSVDFTNEETRSVSLPIGYQSGLTADTFFALVDMNDVVIAEIYPFEILSNRFWSGPLSADAFAKVGIGTRAQHINLEPRKAMFLVDEFRARAAALRGAMARLKRDRLEQSLRELNEEILYLNNVLGKYQRERIELRVRLRRERQTMAVRLDRINGRIDSVRDDLDELEDDRDDLVEERNRLASRSDPPTSRIQRLDERIADLNDEINELRDDIREMRDDRREARKDAERRGVLKINKQLEEIGIEESRVKIDLEERKAEREVVLIELERLNSGDQ